MAVRLAMTWTVPAQAAVRETSCQAEPPEA